MRLLPPSALCSDRWQGIVEWILWGGSCWRQRSHIPSKHGGRPWHCAGSRSRHLQQRRGYSCKNHFRWENVRCYRNIHCCVYSIFNHKSIGWFLYSGISNIFCLAATPPTLGDYALNFDSELAVKVPSSAVSAYQSSWGTNYSRMTISAGDPTSATTAANSGSTTHWATFSNTYSDSELSVEAGKYQ